MQLSSISSALYSGLNGYKTAEKGVAEAADNISKLNTNNNLLAPEQATQNAAPVAPGVAEVANARVDSNRFQTDLNTEAVNLIVNEHLAKASVKVMRTADEMIGTLIDTKV